MQPACLACRTCCLNLSHQAALEASGIQHQVLPNLRTISAPSPDWQINLSAFQSHNKFYRKWVQGINYPGSRRPEAGSHGFTLAQAFFIQQAHNEVASGILRRIFQSTLYDISSCAETKEAGSESSL